MSEPLLRPNCKNRPGRALRAYLLGELDHEALVSLQRHLIYDVGGGPGDGAVVVCHHPPGITVGREGSRLHVRLDEDEMTARRWPVRWVARGGGVMLHVPGQVAVYPILSLADLGLTAVGYVRALCDVLVSVLGKVAVNVVAEERPPGVAVGRRRIAHVGIAVRGGVTSFGAVLNVGPDLELFRGIDCDGRKSPMTSIDREASAPVRAATVRQLLIDEVAQRFDYERVSLFHTHPALAAGPSHHAPVAARPG